MRRQTKQGDAARSLLLGTVEQEEQYEEPEVPEADDNVDDDDNDGEEENVGGGLDEDSQNDMMQDIASPNNFQEAVLSNIYDGTGLFVEDGGFEDQAEFEIIMNDLRRAVLPQTQRTILKKQLVAMLWNLVSFCAYAALNSQDYLKKGKELRILLVTQLDLVLQNRPADNHFQDTIFKFAFPDGNFRTDQTAWTREFIEFVRMQ
jgi:hypothetical protein